MYVFELFKSFRRTLSDFWRSITLAEILLAATWLIFVGGAAAAIVFFLAPTLDDMCSAHPFQAVEIAGVAILVTLVTIAVPLAVLMDFSDTKYVDVFQRYGSAWSHHLDKLTAYIASLVSSLHTRWRDCRRYGSTVRLRFDIFKQYPKRVRAWFTDKLARIRVRVPFRNERGAIMVAQNDTQAATTAPDPEVLELLAAVDEDVQQGSPLAGPTPEQMQQDLQEAEHKLASQQAKMRVLESRKADELATLDKKYGDAFAVVNAEADELSDQVKALRRQLNMPVDHESTRRGLTLDGLKRSLGSSDKDKSKAPATEPNPGAGTRRTVKQRLSGT